jgi:hypothetical protein
MRPSDLRGIDRLLEGARSHWDLSVFDTLVHYVDGDENSVKDMSSAVRGCDGAAPAP